MLATQITFSGSVSDVTILWIATAKPADRRLKGGASDPVRFRVDMSLSSIFLGIVLPKIKNAVKQRNHHHCNILPMAVSFFTKLPRATPAASKAPLCRVFCSTLMITTLHLHSSCSFVPYFTAIMLPTQQASSEQV